MRKQTLVGSAAFALLLLCLTNLTAVAQSGRQLKVMTWNIHGGNAINASYREGHQNDNCRLYPANLDPVEQKIRERNPDVVALQEIHQYQAFALRDKLTNHQTRAVFVWFVKTKRCACDPNNVCYPTDPSRDYDPYHPHPNASSDYGNAIIVIGLQAERPRYYHIYDDPETFKNHHEYTMLEGVSVKLQGGQWVRVYNTHLTGDYSIDPNSGPLQLIAATFTIYLADTPYLSSDAVLLTGDFNIHAPLSPFYKWISTLGYKDTWAEWSRTHPGLQGNTVPAPSPTGRIDYILTRNGMGRIDGADVLNTGGVSDHFPVVAQLFF